MQTDRQTHTILMAVFQVILG